MASAWALPGVFIEAGATVHVTGTRATADEYDEPDLDQMTFHHLDACDDEAVLDCAEQFDQLDVLVVSVGTVRYGRGEFEMQAFREVIDVNLNGVMSLCSAFHPALCAGGVESGASIVLIGSTSSFIATPGQPAYSASKGALVTLTKSLAHAWARNGIRVNGVAPGFVRTKLTERSHEDPTTYDATIERIPLRRWGGAEEMGDAAVFFGSTMSSYVTGQMLLVDGGITLM